MLSVLAQVLFTTGLPVELLYRRAIIAPPDRRDVIAPPDRRDIITPPARRDIITPPARREIISYNRQKRKYNRQKRAVGVQVARDLLKYRTRCEIFFGKTRN